MGASEGGTIGKVITCKGMVASRFFPMQFQFQLSQKEEELVGGIRTHVVLT
jgi:hypothetical protein